MVEVEECVIPLGHHLRSVAFEDVGVDVKRGHEKIRGACGLDHLEFVLKDVRVNAVGVEVEKGTLRKGCKGFVNGVDGDVRSLLLRRLRHDFASRIREELEMGAVGLVHDENFAAGVHDVGDCLNVGTDAVVVRRRKDDGLGVGVFGQTAFDLFGRDDAGDAVLVDHLRIRIHRFNSGKNQGVEDGFVGVSRHNELFSLRNCRHDRGNDAAAGSVDEKIRSFCAVEFCVLFLGGFEDSFGLEQVVCTRNFGDVAVHDRGQERFVAEPPVDGRSFVARHVKGDRVVFCMLKEEVQNGKCGQTGIASVGKYNGQENG